MAAVGAPFVIRKPQFWAMPLLGGLAFPLASLALASTFFGVSPAALEQWNLTSLSGILVFGVPVEEIQRAVGFGTVWPLLMAHALDVRPINPPVA